MRKNSREINIISGWYGPNNFGDEAILEAILEQLEKNEGLDRNSIVVFSLIKNKTKELFPNQKVVRQFPNDIKELVKSLLTLDFFVTLYYLFKAKRLYVGGGGFLSDWQSNNFGWLTQIIIAKITGAECKLWGVGIGPFNRPFSTGLASWCFKKFIDSAYVRDEVSHKELSQKLNFNKKIIVKPDPVATMDTQIYRVERSEASNRIVFIPAYYFKNKKFKSEVELWNILLNNFCKTVKFTIEQGFLVDIVFFQPGSEHELKDEIQQELKAIGCKDNFKFHFLNDHREAFQIMGESRGVISFRLHGNIMAHAIDKPFLPIIYHFKSEEFLTMVDKADIEKILVGDGIHLRKTDMNFDNSWLPQTTSFLKSV
ncbi:polysaccharide pyruvyl transferase family protein [Vibrio harveyi]|uniref:polysaccharide pyruvyl transferase family protein n=1 Tax=Vibrio harveyi TaxID=669 RepID=UPI0012630482|nr:polysaccharide pyruvyl transferase family protein [Vibrio harveyi]QFQ78771.1 hypothetical protein F9277_15750 [Vibrio harveyi]